MMDNDELKSLTPSALRREVQRLRAELRRADMLLEQANAKPIPFDFFDAPPGVYSSTYTNRGRELTPIKGKALIVDADKAWYQFELDAHQFGIRVMANDSIGFFPQVTNIGVIHAARATYRPSNH